MRYFCVAHHAATANRMLHLGRIWLAIEGICHPWVTRAVIDPPLQVGNQFRVSHRLSIVVAAVRIKAGVEVINYAMEIRLRAERLLGEMLAKTERNKGGQPEQKRSTGSFVEPVDRTPTLPELGLRTPTLPELGLDKKLSSRAQTLATIPEPRTVPLL
jgi:hypothetical protein